MVGMGCRFPGAGSSPQKFWDLLVNKTDAIIDVPLDRWDNRRFYHDDDGKPGKTRCKQGGFLQENIAEFDSLFFGISPRQGECLDPQSRLLLEVSYEAIEDAGLTLDELKGSKTGVYVGCFTFDNSLLQISHGNDKIMDSNTSTGLSFTILSNRIAYAFDLKGPALSIDTACSSSMVALNYACESLWKGETTASIVGGVNLVLLPYNSVSMSKGMFLSKDGRCKAFDDRANGYVRSEGAGAVLLKPLSKAIEDKDRIYSVILGTGVNQDGQTNGMTVPSKEAQKELIQSIYEKHQIDANKIHYFEAHGTGTPVGDPLEFSAINEVLTENGSVKEKKLIGSVKTNIGHLEAGAGIAGIIKTALCLHNNAVPANLHFENPNPALNYEHSLLKVPTETEQLPENEISMASINSFGYGGTNAHAVLRQFEPSSNGQNHSEPIKLKKDQFVFPITAKSKSALKQLAGSYKQFLENNPDQFDQILSNAIYRKTHFENRLAVSADSSDELIEKLEAYEEDILVTGVVENRIAKSESKIVFVYTGMGPQWWKMGRDLMVKEPVFYQSIKECDQYFTKIAGWSILEEMQKPEEISRIKETRIAQPANFVLQVAITRLLEHYGIVADAVVGHSVGEVASTYLSGALTLEEALSVSFHRSRLQQTTAGKGKMIAVGLGEQESSSLINGYKNVSIAAINSPNSITLAGDETNIIKIAKKCEGKGVFNRVLDVEVPYHSPVMSLIKDNLLTSVENVKGQPTAVDLYSTVTGDKIHGGAIDNVYWWRNVREPVRFSKVVKSLVQDGYNIFVEIGPHPVLKNSIRECAGEQNQIHLVQTLNRKKNELVHFYENLALLYSLGTDLKWDNWIDRSAHLDLPTYPWQKELLWRETKASRELRIGRSGNVFLNRMVIAPQPTYEVELNKYYFPFIVDHKIQDRKVFPGAAYITAGVALSQFVIENEFPATLEHIEFNQMLSIDESKVQNIYTSYNPNNYQYTIFSREARDDASWIKRSTGKIVVGKQKAGLKKLNIDELLSRMQTVVTETEVYERLCGGMLDLGPFFQTVKSIHVNGDELIGKVKLHANVRAHESDYDYLMHPSLLDGCFQTLIGFETGYDRTDFVPISIDKIHFNAKPDDEVYCYSVLKHSDPKVVIADIHVCNADGTLAVEIENFRCQGIIQESVQEGESVSDHFVYPVWVKEEETQAENTTIEETYYILTSDYEVAIPFINGFSGNTVVLESAESYQKVNDRHFKIDLNDLEVLKEIVPAEQRFNLVSLLGLSLDNIQDTTASQRSIDYIKPVMNLVRYMHQNTSINCWLDIITRGGQQIGLEKLMNAEVGALQGLGRLIVNEIPNCGVRLFDLDPISGKEANAVLNIISQRAKKQVGRFEELAFRNGELYLHKFEKGAKLEKESTLESVQFHEHSLKLFANKRAGIDGMRFVATERMEPQADQIEILVDQASVSDKDYLKVKGRLSLKAMEGTYSGEQIGMDCVGTITRVGAAVTDFKVGDEVIAIVPGAFQTYTNTSAHLAIHKPEQFDDLGSFALTNHLTALYALKDRANLKKEDRVLIHEATSGLGMAAVHYAQSIGAKIIATANSNERREYLSSIGIQHVLDSEDLSFAQAVMEVTERKGVNVVFSSLTGEMAYQNFSILDRCGVYLDVGERNNLESSFIPSNFFTNNLSYISINVDRMLEDCPRSINKSLTELKTYFKSPKWNPLPTKMVAPNQVSEAFKIMESNQEVGSMVVDFKNQPVNIDRDSVIVNATASYLITGGTRGLGLEIGKWLVENGAKHIALLSRSGLKEDYAKETVNQLIEQGINVQVYSADIGDPVMMERVFMEMNQDMPGLAGIFHCAMVLDDAYLMDLDEARFKKVFDPKINGAVNLFNLTKDMDLDYFVMFSSISSLIGNIGQGNYVAANAYLDSFAHYVKSRGVNGIALNLGVMRDSGVVARNKNLGQMLESFGTRGLTNEQFFKGLKVILKERPTQVGFFNLDWDTFFQNTGDSSKFLFESMVAASESGHMGLSDQQLENLEKIKSLEPAERRLFVVSELTQDISAILKIKSNKVDKELGVNFLGVDSILATELIRKIKNNFLVDITPIEFLSGPSITELSKMIITRLQAQYLT